MAERVEELQMEELTRVTDTAESMAHLEVRDETTLQKTSQVEEDIETTADMTKTPPARPPRNMPTPQWGTDTNLGSSQIPPPASDWSASFQTRPTETNKNAWNVPHQKRNIHTPNQTDPPQGA